MTGFTADPESLSAAAQQMRQVAQQLVPAWQPVAQQTESVRFGEGYDIVSPLIQATLMGALQIVNSCVATSTDALNDYADGLESMAKTYGDTESGITAMLRPGE